MMSYFVAHKFLIKHTYRLVYLPFVIVMLTVIGLSTSKLSDVVTLAVALLEYAYW